MAIPSFIIELPDIFELKLLVICIGDVLFSKEVQPADIKVGDDISYFGKSGDVKDKVVTHRVTEIEKDENDNLLFHTQGTANIIEDPIVYSDQIYGKVIYKTMMNSCL